MLDILKKEDFYTYEDEWKGNAFFFSTGIITDAGTYIIH